LLTVGGLLHLIAGILEQGTENTSDGRFVVGD